MRPRRIVMLYGDRPSGHAAAAQALREEFRKKGARVFELCLSKDLHPLFGTLVSAAYIRLVQAAPSVWEYLYDNPTVSAALKSIRQPLSIFARRRLRESLGALKPDLVVCTHALPCATLAALKERGALKAPLAAVLTDFCAHDYWITPQVDRYLVHDEEVKADLVRRGIPAEKVRPTGIPVRAVLRRRLSPAAARKRLGLLPERRTVAFCGGTKGLGSILDCVGAMLSSDEPWQALVLCGKNAELLRRLRARRPRDPRLKALGFTRRVADCLAASDVLVGKPGGVTAAEAAAAGVPMLVAGALPGQEERNLARLLAAGCAVRLDSPADLPGALRVVLGHGRRLAGLQRAARRFGRPDSAEIACRELLDLLKSPSP